jgi:hypothetical protein
LISESSEVEKSKTEREKKKEEMIYDETVEFAI